MQDEPDRELLRRFTHGDREAFESLFRQFEREVYRWILRIVREPQMAARLGESPRWSYIDLGLAAAAAVTLAVFPEWLWLLAYHL